MTSLVEDLLLLARLDAGRPLEREPVDLTLLCLDAVSDAARRRAGARWNLELPDEPVEVLGDAARLHQVLANLLANARTHTPPGTTVDRSAVRPAGSDALLQVRDKGPGIPAALLPDVFERFARGDSPAPAPPAAPGSGWRSSRPWSRRTSGTVDVVSSPQGTEFSVRLPMDGVAARDPSGLAEPATAR